MEYGTAVTQLLCQKSGTVRRVASPSGVVPPLGEHHRKPHSLQSKALERSIKRMQQSRPHRTRICLEEVLSPYSFATVNETV